MMKRFMRVLSLAGLSSVYLMAGNCTMTGDGWSFVQTLGLNLRQLLPFLP
ncbi:MAG: hypothetical protein HY718_20490 [Planctomycetes bacterium]|nr:hypothetical protein [Planctomycetota bacterium]